MHRTNEPDLIHSTDSSSVSERESEEEGALWVPDKFGNRFILELCSEYYYMLERNPEGYSSTIPLMEEIEILIEWLIVHAYWTEVSDEIHNIKISWINWYARMMYYDDDWSQWTYFENLKEIKEATDFDPNRRDVVREWLESGNDDGDFWWYWNFPIENQEIGYGEWDDSDDINHDMHAYNGNIDSLYESDEDYMSLEFNIWRQGFRYNCKFKIAENKFVEDELLNKLSRMHRETTYLLLKKACYWFCTEYLLSPYVLNMKGKARTRALVQLLNEKSVKYDHKFGNNTSIGKCINYYIIKRLKWFVRNMVCVDDDGCFLDHGYLEAFHQFKLKSAFPVIKSQMYSAAKVAINLMGDPEARNDVKDIADKIDAVTDKIQSEGMNNAFDKMESVMDKFLSAMNVLAENSIIKAAVSTSEMVLNFFNTVKEVIDRQIAWAANQFGCQPDSMFAKSLYALFFCVAVLFLILTIGTVTTFVCELVRLATGALFNRVVTIDNPVESQSNFPLYHEVQSQMYGGDLAGTLFVMGIYLATGFSITKPGFSREITGWGSILSAFCSEGKTFLNECVKKWCGVDLFMENDGLPEMTAYLESVIDLCFSDDVIGRVQLDQQLANRVIDLYNKTFIYRKVLLDPKVVKKTNQNQINIALSKLEVLYNLALTASPEVHDRPEPVSILLQGLAGQGKTTMLKLMPELVWKCLHNMDKLKTFDDKGVRNDYFRLPWSPNLMYARNSSDQYWSKWQNNPIVLFDERFTSASSEDRIIEAKEMVDVIGTSKMPLTDAAVENKGRYHMMSRLALITTNVRPENFVHLGLSEPAAFVRRMYFPLEVSQREKYDEEKQNYDDAWRFKCINFGSICNLWKREADLAVSFSGLIPGHSYCLTDIVNMTVSLIVKRHFKEGSLFKNVNWEERIVDGKLISSRVKRQPQLLESLCNDPINTPDMRIPLFREVNTKYVLVNNELVCNQMFSYFRNSWYGFKDEIKQSGQAENLVNIETDSEDEGEWMDPYCLDIHLRIVPCLQCMLQYKGQRTSPQRQEHLLRWMFEDKLWKAYINLCLSLTNEECIEKLHQAIRYVETILDSENCNHRGHSTHVCQHYDDEHDIFADPISSYDKAGFRFGRIEYDSDRYWGTEQFDISDFVRGAKNHALLTPFVFKYTCFIEEGKLAFSQFLTRGRLRIIRFKTIYASKIKEMVMIKCEEISEAIQTTIKDVWNFIVLKFREFMGWKDHVVMQAKDDYKYFIQNRGEDLKMIRAKLERADSWWSTLCDFTREYWLEIVATLGLIFVSSVAISAIAKFCSVEERFAGRREIPFRHEGELDHKTFSESWTSRYVKEIPGGRPRARYHDVVKSQANIPERMTFLEKVVMTNSRIVEIVGCNGKIAESNILFIHTKMAVIPKHAYYSVPISHLVIRSTNGEASLPLTLDEFSISIPRDRDCVFLRFRQAQHAIDIRKHFMRGSKTFIGSANRLMKMCVDGVIGVFYDVGGKTHYKTTRIEGTIRDPMGNLIKTPMEGYYEVEDGGGFDGACAYPVVSCDTEDYNNCFIGIHVAQRGANSIVCPLFQSDFDDAVVSQSFNCVDPYSDEFTNFPSRGMKGVDSYYKPKDNWGAHSKTVLRKSVISDFLPSETLKVAPAKLEPFVNDNGVKISPHQVFCAKYDTYRGFPKPRTLSDLEKDPELLWGSFEPKLTNFKHSWCTIEDVLFGNSEKGIEALEGNSSSGFRYRNRMAKRNMWYRKPSRDEPEGWIHPYLQQDVAARIHGMKQGIKYTQVVIDALKDELRSVDRVKAGKTRVFCVGEFVACIIAKMFMECYFSECKKHRSMGSSAVGTNPHSSDWNYLGKDIFRFGRDRVVGGDLPTQDISIQRFLGQVAFEYLKCKMNLVDQSDINVLEAICFAMVTTIHVVSSWAYLHEKGNSSGQWCTSWFATFCTKIWMTTCYYYNRPIDRDETFEQMVSQKYYGDDNLGSVHPDCYWFDNIQIASALKDLFNLGFTDPNKGEITTPWLELKDQIFLAREFREENGEYLAPLSEDSMFGMLHFIRHHESIDDLKQLTDNVGVFASELAHYSKEKSDVLWEIVKTACHEAGVTYAGRDPDYWRTRRHEIAYQTYQYV